MKRFLIILSIFATTASYAQNDTTLSRVVTVERDFQPVIHSAGKINQRPSIIDCEAQLNPVVYSTYSAPLSIDYNINLLRASETRFINQAPLQGLLEGAVGYRNSRFQFAYRIHQKKQMSLNLYAKHDAYWGRDALSQSQVGMWVARHFQNIDLYFAVEGNNDYFSYFGRYYDGVNGLKAHSVFEKMYLNGPYINMTDQDWQTLWQASAKIGVQSTSNKPLQYRIQTGYQAYIATHYAIEHQIRSQADISWQSTKHQAGIKAYVQNNLYSSISQTSTIPTPAPRHAIRVEPFYEYNDKNIHLHAGVNIDMNIHTGQLLSQNENISFAPSPNIQFEWNMMDNIFHIYANAQGSFATGTLQEYMGYNRYLNIVDGLSFASPRAYTPVDAQVGFKIRPIKTLLIDIYGGYAYMWGVCNMMATIDTLHANAPAGIRDYTLWQSDYQRWKVGAAVHYHYRDILSINLAGNYYFYQQEPIPSMDPTAPYFQEMHTKATTIFDRPNWDALARIDVHIDSKWSIYSENYFAGSRWAYTTLGKKQLKPTISLNIGGQYAINRWLIAYLQLNNYLNRKNDIFYGYQSQGIHFLVGVKWKF